MNTGQPDGDFVKDQRRLIAAILRRRFSSWLLILFMMSVIGTLTAKSLAISANLFLSSGGNGSSVTSIVTSPPSVMFCLHVFTCIRALRSPLLGYRTSAPATMD